MGTTEARTGEPANTEDWNGGYEAGFADGRAALAATSAPAERPATPEGEAERFIQAAISNSPKPLQELGRHLSEWLDEDKWATAERLLLALATSAPSKPAPLRKFVEHCLTLEGGMVSGNLLKYEAEKVLAEAAALQSTPAVPQPEAAAEPIDMVLHCPACGQQHIDEPEEHWNRAFLYSWENPPHRSHLCHHCGHIWRPADVPTNGVAQIKTCGKNDSPLATPPAAEVEERRELSDDEILACWSRASSISVNGKRRLAFGRAVIAKSKEKAS